MTKILFLKEVNEVMKIFPTLKINTQGKFIL